LYYWLKEKKLRAKNPSETLHMNNLFELGSKVKRKNSRHPAKKYFRFRIYSDDNELRAYSPIPGKID